MYIKTFEIISNLPKWYKIKTINGSEYTDLYFIYKLDEKEIGKYLNNWFVGVVMQSPDTKKTYKDEMITVKQVDTETADHLYRKKYNSITLNIMCPTGAKFKQDENGNDLYDMKAQIHSIDDASYSIWWNSYETLNKSKSIREKIMRWINLHSEINGEIFLNYCVSLGADKNSKDYN